MWLLITSVVILSTTAILFSSTVENVAGHGSSSETFPPVDLNGKQVTLEVSSSAPPPPETTGRPPAGITPGEDLQIAMALIDFESQITLRDVTFQVRADLGDRFLFEQEFKADDGFLVFNFISTTDESITVNDLGDTDNQPDALAYLLGSNSRTINVSGPKLADGGLYRFEIAITTAGDYAKTLDDPLTYSSGISIPQIITYAVDDPNFGEQYIRVITYYDEIQEFEYDSELKEIEFFMPFEWSDKNLNQSYVVHEEISIPDTYGDLLVSGFDMYINNIKLPEEMIVIDDFFVGERIIHFIIPQEQLYVIRNNTKNMDSNVDGMNFVIRPDVEYTRLSSVTENGQFRIFVSWEPEELKSGQRATIMFEITDVFLKNSPVAVNYEFTVTKDNIIIFEQFGTSTDSKDNFVNLAEFVLSDDVSGIVHLNFENIAGNERAKTSIPIAIDRIAGKAIVDDGTIGIIDTANMNDVQGGGGGCLIATAVYGSEMSAQVQQLRELRDDVILDTASGSMFIFGFNTVYYSFSPAISDIQREHPILREMTRIMLTPLLTSLSLLQHINIDTDYEMIIYGVGIIILNLLIYIGLPVFTVILLRKKLGKKMMAHISKNYV